MHHNIKKQLKNNSTTLVADLNLFCFITMTRAGSQKAQPMLPALQRMTIGPWQLTLDVKIMILL